MNAREAIKQGLKRDVDEAVECGNQAVQHLIAAVIFLAASQYFAWRAILITWWLAPIHARQLNRTIAKAQASAEGQL